MLDKNQRTAAVVNFLQGRAKLNLALELARNKGGDEEARVLADDLQEVTERIESYLSRRFGGGQYERIARRWEDNGT